MNSSSKFFCTLLIAGIATAVIFSSGTESEAPVSAQVAASQLVSSSADLTALPTGRYYFAPPDQSSTSRKRPSFVLFRKSGSTIIGWDHRSALEPACFRGFIEGDQVVRATRLFAPYQPDSVLQSGETIDMSGLESTDHEISAAEAQSLQTCMNFFWR